MNNSKHSSQNLQYVTKHVQGLDSQRFLVVPVEDADGVVIAHPHL